MKPQGSMMTDEEILAEFRAAEALLEGHFILSSGLRSPRYLQCARVLMNPARAERLATELARPHPRQDQDSPGRSGVPGNGRGDRGA
jgi:orotate phosphoribosyltransferase